MKFVWDSVRRLEAEPLLSDPARGFAAEVADPAWMLGRQWQLGEHQGEDASSPVDVVATCPLVPIDPLDGDAVQDPLTTPAQAIVESEPHDFWTPGRRVIAGRRVAAAAAAAGSPLPADDTLALDALPVPYDGLDRTGPDGRALWLRRAALGLDESWFGAIRPPGEPRDLWNPAELAYDADFQAAGSGLLLRRHDGGDLDWYSVDANQPLPEPGPPTPAASVTPTRLRYPGAPEARWWQIEDAKVDIGGYPPDRSHLATLLVIDLVMNQSDDWFTFPVAGLSGHVATLEHVTVVDSFGDKWELQPPSDGWTLFATSGLDPRSLVLWATASTPLQGPVLDEVVLGIDEDANLVWAVERRLRAREVPTEPDPPPSPPTDFAASGRPRFAYRASTRVPLHWHPYVIPPLAIDGRRRFVQGRAADLSGSVARLLPPPESDLLIDPASGGVHPVHQIEPAAIPADGIRLERRAMLARRTDGSPILWTQRRTQPLLTPPALRLRFDVLDPAPGAAP